MKNPLIKDERGSFQELLHVHEIEFGQLSLLTVNPKYARGGHYHKRKTEWFCCINGRCKFEVLNIKKKTQKIVILESEGNKTIIVRPYEAHTVINLEENRICELLVVANEVYNPQDSDTFKI